MLITLGAGHEIVFNIGASATKFFTLATKSWKLVAKLATRMFHHNLTKRLWIKKICKDKSTANFLVKFDSKTQHMYLDRQLDTILDLGELERCISSILVSTL